MGHVIDRAIECFFVCTRWLCKSGKLPNKLQRGCANFILSSGWTEVMKCLDGSAHVGIINKSRLTINYFVFADHADKTVLFFQPTFFSLVPSATQILTKIEKQNLLGDADVFRLGEETQGFFAAFAANAALFHSAERDAQIAH
jgi:hypothetical protein